MSRGPVTQRKIDLILKLSADGMPQKDIRMLAHVGSQTLTAVLKGELECEEMDQETKLLREWDAIGIYAMNCCVLPGNMWIYVTTGGTNSKGVILANSEKEAKRRVKLMHEDWGDRNIEVEVFKVGRGMSPLYPDILEVHYEE